MSTTRRKCTALKVLVDECLTPRLAKELERRLPDGWTCSSVSASGLVQHTNGGLHRAAVDAGYKALITRDMTMAFETPPLLPVVVIPSTGALSSAEKYVEDLINKVTNPQLGVRYHTVEPREGEDLFDRRKQQMADIRERQVTSGGPKPRDGKNRKRSGP